MQLKSSLQELIAERRKLQQNVENTKSKCARFEGIARKLKDQNEVLCERVSVSLVGGCEGGEGGRGRQRERGGERKEGGREGGWRDRGEEEKG